MINNNTPFWEVMFALINPDWNRVHRPGKNYAVYTRGNLRFITQNLELKSSPNTVEILNQRARGIYADTIWVSVARASFSYRINVRIINNRRYGEIWRLGAKRGDPSKLVGKFPTSVDWEMFKDQKRASEQKASRPHLQLTLPVS